MTDPSPMSNPSVPGDPFEACFLVDNGSLRPAATRSLRRLATDVSARVGRLVEPVSLLHSSTIDAAELDGVAAEIFEPAARMRLQRGVRRLLLLPLFFGPTRALTIYVPQRVEVLRKRAADLQVQIAPWLAPLEYPDDDTVARMLAEQVEATRRANGWERPQVVLVDHGSPVRKVTAVRDLVALQLEKILGDRVRGVIASSMERREEEKYAFNEPLLERALREQVDDAVPVIVAMLFLQPGRHAGEGGDVAEICAAAQQERPALQIARTPLLGSHAGLVALLARRYKEACAGKGFDAVTRERCA